MITLFSIIILVFILPLFIIYLLKKKDGIKEKKVKYLNIAMVAMIILSIIINIASFVNGGTSSVTGIIITILYIISWFAFIWLSKANRNSLIFSAIWSLSTLACAAVTLAVNINDSLDVSFMIPFAMLFITPLYGIESFFSKREYSITIIAIISLTWVVMSFIYLKSKGKKQINS